MKIYDKNIYKTQQGIKTTIIIIVCFLLGFIVGYLSNSFSTKDTNTTNYDNNVNNEIINSLETDDYNELDNTFLQN